MAFPRIPRNAPKPAVSEDFFNDPLFLKNPKFYEFYCCLHRVPKEIYDCIYHDSFCGLSPRELQSVYRNTEFSALLYSIFRRTYLPHLAKGLAGAEVAVFMRDVASSEQIYLCPTSLRFQPENRVYTFSNIVQLDVKVAHASDYPIVQPIQHMLLVDLTFRYPPDTGKHIIPLMLSWNPQTSGLRGLRKLRLVASEYGFHGYDHKPKHIYWDHPEFARALHLFPSLAVLAFVHPAYVVPIKDPIWQNDDDGEEIDDADDVEEEVEEDEEDYDDGGRADDAEEGMEADDDEGRHDDDEGIEENMEDTDEEDDEDDSHNYTDGDHDHDDHGNEEEEDHIDKHEVKKEADEERKDQDQDERLFQARRALRFEQEARYGPRRRRFYLEEADWQSGEQLLVMEWASPSLSTIFLVYAHDEASQVRGDFSLEQDIVNGRFSHWIRDSSGHWTRCENEYYTRRRGKGGPGQCFQNAADLKLSGMQFADDCWSYSDRGIIMLTSAQYNDLYI
ncbi:hypothetical protein BDZ89DRAFT_1173137 [Hymenopellis radicata]|nr:hypothetical protein BDZ89DRAFT_1173137 [Hymenopellis radicata]